MSENKATIKIESDDTTKDKLLALDIYTQALEERLDKYQKQSQNLVDMCADMYNDLTALKHRVDLKIKRINFKECCYGLVRYSINSYTLSC